MQHWNMSISVNDEKVQSEFIDYLNEKLNEYQIPIDCYKTIAEILKKFIAENAWDIDNSSSIKDAIIYEILNAPEVKRNIRNRKLNKILGRPEGELITINMTISSKCSFDDD